MGNFGDDRVVKKLRMRERRVACEPAVEDEETGGIAEHERSKDCIINYLCRGQKASLIYIRGVFYRD